MALATGWCQLPESRLDAQLQACAEFDTQERLVCATPSLLALLGVAVLHPGAPLHWLAGHLKLESLLLRRAGQSNIGGVTSAVSLNVPTCNGLRDLRVTSVFAPEPEGGQVRKVLVEDITDPAASASVQVQQEPLRRFLSHDLRAPIAAMISQLRQETRKLVDATHVGTTAALLHQATKMLSSVDDFALAVAADLGQLHWTESLLENLLEDAIGNALPKLKTKGQLAQQAAACEPIFINADGQLMVRALVYLLTKAADIAPPDSQITWEVRSSHTAQKNAQPAQSLVIAISHRTGPAHSPLATGESYPIGVGFVQNVTRQHCGIFSQEQTSDGLHTVSLRLPCTVHP